MTSWRDPEIPTSGFPQQCPRKSQIFASARNVIGRFVGGATLNRGHTPVEAISKSAGPVFAGNPLANTRRRRQRTSRRSSTDSPHDALARSRNPDFRNSGNRRFSRRPEIGRFAHGAPRKCGSPPDGAIGHFPDPVFAGSPLANTRRRRQKMRRRNPIGPRL